MAAVYPTSGGNWSTLTWNDDATGSAYGPGSPQPGDTVYANGQAVTIDVDIDVESVRTTAGTTASAGGSFTTVGTGVTVTADSYGGTSTCLTLAGGTAATQIGNSYGSTTSIVNATFVLEGCTQIGNAYGGNGASRLGTRCNYGGTLIGNSYGGSGHSTAYGAYILTGGTHVGDSFGGTAGIGTYLFSGTIHTGNSTGGSASGAHGTSATNGGIHYGNATGGSASGAYGTLCTAGGYIANCIATGHTSGAYGVRVAAYATVLLVGEVGLYPKNITAGAFEDDTRCPLFTVPMGGASRPSHPMFSQVIG